MAGAVAALVLCAPASAEYGRLHVGDIEVSHRTEYAFDLTGPWEQARGQMEATPSIGNYRRRVSLGHGGTCQLDMTTFGEVGLRAPTFANGALLDMSATFLLNGEAMPVTARGSSARLRWYVGPRRRDHVTGVAVLAPTPAALRRHARVTIVTMHLTHETERWDLRGGYRPLTPTDRQRHTCVQIQADAARGALPHALASVHLRPIPTRRPLPVPRQDSS